MNSFDLVIIGAGPAGMSAAITARRRGLTVMVVDDQPEPGGQIWRSVERAAARDDILGPSYSEGRPVAAAFRACGATYAAGAQLWKIEPGFSVFTSQDRKASLTRARAVILATGAQERPAPFPGWTLPGVLTVGAAQILLKNAGQIPTGAVWIAGSGPLPLLYAIQFLSAGGALAGYLDTTPAGRWRKALPHLPAALRAPAELLKGLGWMARLQAGGARFVRGVTDLRARGQDQLETLSYRTGKGPETVAGADTLLVHEGVVPHIHAALSLDCEMAWNAAQDCFAPVLDPWGESSLDGLFIAGDGAGIGGAKAAKLGGQLAALRIAHKLNFATAAETEAVALPARRRLDRELAMRPFLDAMFRPRAEIFAPPDDTIVCRCEELTAGAIRAGARVGRPGPNQLKAATRAGMGPCQGRQCGYTVARLVGAAQGRTPSEVGFFHVRPPLKPVTLGELASLENDMRA